MSRIGITANETAQQALRDREKLLAARAEADLERVLKQDWGRRFFYRLTHEYGRLVAPSYEPDIKDGVCSAIRMARNEGIREVAMRLVEQAQKHCPDLWLQMLAEAVAENQSELERSRAASERQEQT